MTSYRNALRTRVELALISHLGNCIIKLFFSCSSMTQGLFLLFSLSFRKSFAQSVWRAEVRARSLRYGHSIHWCMLWHGALPRPSYRWRGKYLPHLIIWTGVRVCGDAVLRNFYLHSRYCGFQTLSGLRLLHPFGEEKVSAVMTLVISLQFNSVVCYYGLFQLILNVINRFGQWCVDFVSKFHVGC